MKTKTPKEDPRIKSAREAEERRADAAFIENTGQLLDEQTRKRVRRFGNRANAARTGAGAGGGRGGGNRPGGSVDTGAGPGATYNGLDARNPMGGFGGVGAL